MAKKENRIFKFIAIISAVAYCLHASSCASTKMAPTGGPKDTIPPVIIGCIPAEGATSFPLEKGEIEIMFNEYVQVKDPSKNILLSPPLKKQLKTRIKGKSVIFTFPEPLDSNTTYSLNCGNAIVDNNEGNPLYGLTYSFSTGKEIDSMMISGTVVDAQTLFPIENATIALYLNETDSVAITTRPDAVARSDKWGYFTVKNLKPQPYHVFAFSDGNTNNRYDQSSEMIAFLDTTVTPVKVMRKDAPELAYVDIKDTTACLARPSEIELQLFKENSTIQFIRNYSRFSRRGMGIKFNAPNAVADSIYIQGIENGRLIKQFNITEDSLTIWIKGNNKLADTLLLSVNYQKSDSTGKLVPATENLKMVAPYEKKENRRNRGNNDKEEKRKDLLEFFIKADKKSVEQEGVTLEFPAPLESIDQQAISFTMQTPKLVKSNVEYTIKQDSLELSKYVIRPSVQFVLGNDYTITFPAATFRDINGFTNDSTTTRISLPTDENLSSLTLEMKNVDSRYIVELINSKRSQVYRQYIITADCELIFPYLTSGAYSVRITQDNNSNGIIDTGEYLTRKQPEKVRLYKMSDGSDIINISERTDLTQTVDISDIFVK